MESIAIVVAGGVNMDTTFAVEALPKKGETVFATNTMSSLGGKGLNQAVAARRAGARVAILGAIGTDAAGKAIRDFVKSEDIDVSLLQQVVGTDTGRAVIAVDSNADNTIIVDPGANAFARFSTSGLRPHDWPDVRYVAANGEVPSTTVLALFEFARSANIATAWNPSPIPANPTSILQVTDSLIVNEIEAVSLVGKSDSPEQLVHSLAKLGPAEVVLTLGAQGSVLLAEKEVVRMPAPEVGAVDPTAAGDTFLGYYIAKRSDGLAPVDAAGIASVAGSIAVQTVGAVDSIPVADQVRTKG